MSARPAPVTAELGELARAVVAGSWIAEKRAASGEPWPFEDAPPDDVAAFYAACDGLTLVDGTRILPAGDLARTTAWLVDDRSLAWDADLVVIGERADMVVVRDLDRPGNRAGGGILEAPHDDLEAFRRVALTLPGYLAARAGIVDPHPAPEVLLREAVARREARAIEAALARPLYPGTERDEAHAAVTLGALRAGAGDAAGAMAAFERSVAARVRGVRRGAGATETKAAWAACAIAARSAGAPALAAECELRS